MWKEIIKEDEGLLRKVSPKQKKKIKKLVQSSEPSEYMGQDFTKLNDLISELKQVDMLKSDKKLRKKKKSATKTKGVLHKRTLDLVFLIVEESNDKKYN